MTTRKAACSCGEISLVCEGEPVRLSICHCLACQKRTGSVFGAQARYPRGQVKDIRGKASEFVRVAESGNRIAFRFCGSCGSTVWWENSDTPHLIAVAIGAFADPSFPGPRHSVYERTRHAWVKVPDHPGMEHLD